jgi:poly-gamma-glutamate capsule biosynthesis protein CapA/YwtB (metallophosphatase superfamily)
MIDDKAPNFMVVWERSEQLASCKVAVAGDFLPSGNLQPPDAHTCETMADSARPVFENANVLFVNLECPIDVVGLCAAPQAGLGSTLGAPSHVLQYLSRLHVLPVSVANNHIFDFGVAGFEHTRKAVLASGMVPLGCGGTTSDPPTVHVWQSPSGVRVGFWAAARITSQAASSNRVGTEPATLQRAKMAVARLRHLGADCCVALLHAGLERTNYPEPDDVALMDSFAEAGFSLVAASHSHRISGCKLLRTKHSTAACFYGLGSISSGVMYSPLEHEGMVVVLSLDNRGELVRIAANPVAMDDSGWGTVPSFDHEKLIIERFRTITAHIEDGTYRQLFYRETSQDLFARQLRDVAAAFRYGGVGGVLQKIGRARFRHFNRAVQSLIH